MKTKTLITGIIKLIFIPITIVKLVIINLLNLYDSIFVKITVKYPKQVRFIRNLTIGKLYKTIYNMKLRRKAKRGVDIVKLHNRYIRYNTYLYYKIMREINYSMQETPEMYGVQKENVQDTMNNFEEDMLSERGKANVQKAINSRNDK